MSRPGTGNQSIRGARGHQQAMIYKALHANSQSKPSELVGKADDLTRLCNAVDRAPHQSSGSKVG